MNIKIEWIVDKNDIKNKPPHPVKNLVTDKNVKEKINKKIKINTITKIRVLITFLKNFF